MSRVRVEPAPPPPAAYDIAIEPGALGRVAALAAERAPAARYAIIADARVAGLYGERVRSDFAAAGQRADLLEFPAGEAAKTRQTWSALTDALLRLGLGRDGCVIALGGGVTGDLAGFVAATYMRGLPVVQVPTTLLAMVDASVGGKTGVDTPAGKNLVGAFHQPRLVVIDPEVLSTLGEEELRSGLAETVKHGAIADEAYFRWIAASSERILAREPGTLAELIRRSVEIKAGFVSADPYEAGARAALNFGHTVGHAVEALSEFTLPHGYAVALGLVAEAAAGEAAGVTEAGAASSLRDTLLPLGLPTSLPTFAEPERVLAAMRTDKKARAGRVRTTLVERLGRVARTDAGEWTFPLDDALLADVLADLRA